MIVSLTIVRYKKAFIPFALLSMAVHRLPLMLQKGCTFWKLLGTGRNDFDQKPAWQQWGLLAVWKTREDFDRFNRNSFIPRWWNLFEKERWTILCQPLQSHGKWGGKEPFGGFSDTIYSGPVIVLTRATIRPNRSRAFWSHVEPVARIMRAAPGFITSLWLGESPFYNAATFSVWRSQDEMKAFAYGSKEHAEVIRKTRQENWYSEELFARFKPVASYGTLNGKDPLENLLTTT